MKSIIPVFYHIPKNSGTYVYNCILNGIRKHKKNIKVIRVLLEEKYVLVKFIVFDDLNLLNQDSKFIPLNNAKITWNLKIEDLTEDILQKLSICSVFVEARGFRCVNNVLEPLFSFLKRFDLYKFMILREPFSREQSLYHYLTSDKSKHEHTHNVFKSSSFQEHIASDQLQDSWLIRALLDIPFGVKLTEEHYNKACEIIKPFNVYDIKDTEQAVQDVLLKCFDIKEFDKETTSTKKHENLYKKTLLQDLSLDLQKIFMVKKYWDQKLYDYFTTQN